MILDYIDFNIKKSNRKTLSIYIERNGSVSVLAPNNVSEEKLNEAIKSKEYQIYKYLAQWKQLNDSKVIRETVNGQSFLYFGRNYRLQIIENQEEPLVFKNNYFCLSSKYKNNSKEHFINFYKKKLLPKIEEKVNYYKKIIDVEPNEIKVMELQNRWASCSNKGNLNFHWKCAMSPNNVINYIIVHELTHLIHKNHTRAFWNDIDKVIPDYSSHIEWLKFNGARMEL